MHAGRRTVPGEERAAMTMRRLFLALLAVTALCAPQARAGNDDSCDISVAPAATLLLPYFEVDFVSTARTARTTIFTVTNVSAQPQIAHVTLWTDWAYAALTFNLQLAPYGVQSINLHDVFVPRPTAPAAIPLSASPSNGRFPPLRRLRPEPRSSLPLLLQEIQRAGCT